VKREHDWQLVIAGETKDEMYMQALRDNSRELHIEKTVSFIGGQYGDDKHRCLESSHAFILPSFSEGLPMSVLEAWSYHLPALITPECNLTEGYEHNAAIQIQTDPENICKGIQQIISMPPAERVKMGSRGFNLVKEKFSWAQVANSMAQLYNWVLGNGGKPAFVITD